MTNDCVWPSGDYKPVCLLALDYQRMTSLFGLVFEEGRDELDEYYAASFMDEEIGSVLLLQYKNAPVSGIGIYVDTWVNTLRAISRIIEKFSLAESDLKWKSDIE